MTEKGGREGGRYAEKHRGKILEKKRATRCRRTDADAEGRRMDGGCRMLHDGAEFTAKERLIFVRFFVAFRLKGFSSFHAVFMVGSLVTSLRK